MLAVLTTARARNIPAVCANIDFTAVLANGKSAHMPGTLKAAYEAMGGEVVFFGKPQKAFFEGAIEMGTQAFMKENLNKDSETVKDTTQLPRTKNRARVIHVGDSLHHDIAG